MSIVLRSIGAGYGSCYQVERQGRTGFVAELGRWVAGRYAESARNSAPGAGQGECCRRTTSGKNAGHIEVEGTRRIRTWLDTQGHGTE